MILLAMMQNLKKNNISKVTEFIQKRSKKVGNEGFNRL